MKIKKMAGALALTAALAMGTVPAFAAPSVGSGTDNWSPGDKGSTEVKAEVQKIVNEQINATVPLQITVVFGSNGASDIQGPSSSAYYVENTGDLDIKITDVELTPGNIKKGDGSDLFTYTPVRLRTSGTTQAGDPMPTQTTNNLMFYWMTDDGVNVYLGTNHTAKQQTGGATENRYFDGATATAWNDIELASGDTCNITIGGKAYMVDTIASDQLTDALCTIKYTIAEA